MGLSVPSREARGSTHASPTRYAHVHLLHARAPSLSIPPWCLQVRLLVTFTDDTSTAVHYYVLPPYSTRV